MVSLLVWAFYIGSTIALLTPPLVQRLVCFMTEKWTYLCCNVNIIAHRISLLEIFRASCRAHVWYNVDCFCKCILLSVCFHVFRHTKDFSLICLYSWFPSCDFFNVRITSKYPLVSLSVVTCTKHEMLISDVLLWRKTNPLHGLPLSRKTYS